MTEPQAPPISGEGAQGHIIVCGMGHVGYRVVHLLRQLGQSVTVITITSREAWLQDALRMGVRVIYGDARTAGNLIEAGIATARTLIVATDHDLVNVEIALDARRLRKDVPVVIRLFDQTLAKPFETLFDIRRAVDISEMAAPSFVAAALGARVTGSFTIDNVPYIVARIQLDERFPLVGLSVRQVEELHRLAVLLHQSGDGHEDMPDADIHLNAGDWVTVVGSAADLDRAIPDPLIPRAPRRPQGFWGHMSDILHLPLWGPLLQQIWKHAPLALRSALLFLILVLMLSVAVFHYTLDLSYVDAVYFMITTVTTTGYGDINPGSAGPFVKLYASMVMLLGAAALAIIYSIITDFIVTARFEQILGRQRFPQQNHVVVVGLGNVGYRVVNELRRTGAKILAVDRNADGPFVSTIRAHTPVLIGDARVPEVLNTAAVKDASAVIAVTNDDAVNLGIGLLAEQTNGNVYTVLRLFDADFADKVEVDLVIDKALSASRIAAPTFAAAALYDSVCNAFVLNNLLFAVLERTVDAEWEGLTTAELRDHHDVSLIARRTTDGRPPEPLGTTPLRRGDRVLAVIHQRLTPDRET